MLQLGDLVRKFLILATKVNFIALKSLNLALHIVKGHPVL